MVRLPHIPARHLQQTSADEVRRLAVSATDGIVAAAGIAQGLNITDQSDDVVTIALIGSVIAGGLGAASSMYHEYAWERDAVRESLRREREEHRLHPELELTELAQIYERRGLQPELARQVAAELSAEDPLRAHAREELGLSEDDLRMSPLRMSVTGGLAFVVGSLIPLASVLLAPATLHTALTFLSVLFALVITATVVAKAGHTSVLRTVLRTLMIGAVAMVLSMVGGSIID